MNVDKFGQKVKISIILKSQDDDFGPISVYVAINTEVKVLVIFKSLEL